MGMASYTVTGVAGPLGPQTFDEMMSDRKYLVSVVLPSSIVKPNARCELLLEAEATQERTL